jgi:aryl-alcohol dehydrogenase
METIAAVSRISGEAMAIEPVTLAEPRDHEVLVRVVATGICHTDIAMRDSTGRVPKPIVLGHEGAGIVEGAGRGVRRVRPGDHVVMSFDSCGHCPSCNRGDPAYCLGIGQLNFSGQRQDGSTALSCNGMPVHSHFFGQSSFAVHAICSERSLVPVPRDLPLELLGPLGCGFQTGAGAVINALKVAPGSAIAILGAGAVGLAAVMAARIRRAEKIIAVDIHANRLDMALRLGATEVINAGAGDVAGQIMALAGAGLNYALDTTGNLGAIQSALESLAPHGICGLISSGKGASINLNLLQMMLGGHIVRGIHQGDSVPEAFIPQLIDFYRRGDFPFDELLSFYEFKDVNRAMEDMESGRVIKPVLRMPAQA